MKKILLIFVMILLVTSCGKVSSSSSSSDSKKSSSSEKNDNIKTLTCSCEIDHQEYIDELEESVDCTLGDKKIYEYDTEKEVYTKITSERYIIYKDLAEKYIENSYKEALETCEEYDDDEDDYSKMIKTCTAKRDGKKISMIAEVDPEEYLKQGEIDENDSLKELKSKFENEYSEDIDGSYKCSIE